MAARTAWTNDAVLLRLVDWGFGLSAVGWAIRTAVAHGTSIVGVALAALNLAAGVLLLVRRAPQSHAPLGDCALVVASLVMSGIVLKLSPAPESWPLGAAVLFAVAGAGAAASLASLGTSFGVLPAQRGLVARGPYRLVRHPAYGCEALLVLACALARPSAPGPWIAGAAALALLIVRIRLEERLLREGSEYQAYAERVPWRLVPGVW